MVSQNNSVAHLFFSGKLIVFSPTHMIKPVIHGPLSCFAGCHCGLLLNLTGTESVPSFCHVSLLAMNFEDFDSLKILVAGVDVVK